MKIKFTRKLLLKHGFEEMPDSKYTRYCFQRGETTVLLFIDQDRKNEERFALVTTGGLNPVVYHKLSQLMVWAVGTSRLFAGPSYACRGWDHHRFAFIHHRLVIDSQAHDSYSREIDSVLDAFIDGLMPEPIFLDWLQETMPLAIALGDVVPSGGINAESRRLFGMVPIH